MKVLAIETATPASSVALGEDGALTALNVRVDRRGHVGFLIPAIDFCFERTGWDPSDIDIVVVDYGPGPYTGIRAGMATAQAFAAAVGVPLVGVSSLTVQAVRAATGHRRIWSVVDMRRGQVAVAPYRPLPGGVAPDGGAEVVGPDEFRAMLDAEAIDSLVVGDWQALPESIWSGLHRVRFGRPRFPSADVMCEIAAIQSGREDFGQPSQVRPMYMREPDVDIKWETFRSETW
ncbi:MAG: tRNA (adenosine(37)-N6)-threonylcarbamoyltransferase complex dimerization subunit type 1 TsaB [Acidimicrobiia bacterium]|nr:MAG: tRNA (adenosine(37)-N6)-threonylcarbamoyltransferase complex dimerization subunit type 1 TsaB [Acidimicrobiia bacterium]